MIRPIFDAAKIATHWRFRALGEHAQTFYLESLRRAGFAGWIELAALRTMAERIGHGALAELRRCDLVYIEDESDCGAWLQLPQTLDRALALEPMWDQLATAARAHWQAVNEELLTGAEAAGVLATVTQDEWDAGWNALAMGQDR